MGQGEDKASLGGTAKGLLAVLAAVQEDRVAEVFVQEGYAKMGRYCPNCDRLSLDHRSCPWCFTATGIVLDLVSELVDRAKAAGCAVHRVLRDPRFGEVCRIMAELKAPVPAPAAPQDAPPMSRALRARFATKDGRPSPLRARA